MAIAIPVLLEDVVLSAGLAGAQSESLYCVATFEKGEPFPSRCAWFKLPD